jgi:hypothetical protein
MNEETDTQRGTGTEPQPKPETTPTQPNASMPSQDVGWAGASTSQVVRTVAIALLTTAVVLGALFLLWSILGCLARLAGTSFQCHQSGV